MSQDLVVHQGPQAGSPAPFGPQGRALAAMGTANIGADYKFRGWPLSVGATVNYTATLGVPATGDRGQWKAAALFMCKNNVTGDWFLYTGLEDIEDPNPAPDPGTTGSLGAGSVGS